MRTLSCAAILGLCLTPSNAPAQPSHCEMAGSGYVDPAFLEKPTTLQDGIGRVSQKITTRSPEGQAFYDQGLAYLDSYVFLEAARSFHQALRIDPHCAMAWMGLARAEEGLDRHAAAQAAIARAKSLSARATETEKRFIALRTEQMAAVAAPNADEERRRHAAYKESLDRAIAEFPQDAELRVWRGNAEEPGPWGRGQFGEAASIPFYEAALARSPGDLAAIHFLVHSYENVGQPAKAAELGKLYASAAPRVAHAQHMYGHVLPRLGRWEEALAQFEKADAIEERYVREEKLRPGDDWHHAHNLQLLGYTYLRLGRLADAEKTFRRLAETPIRDPIREWQKASLAEFLLLTGRASEALAAAAKLETGSLSARVAGGAVSAEALLALGRLPEAKDAAARAARAHSEKPTLGSQDALRFEGTIGNFDAQAQAELALAGSRPEDGERALLDLADHLASNSRFDAWGEGLFRVERMSQAADRAGRKELARQLRERMRRIDPAFDPGSSIAAKTAGR